MINLRALCISIAAGLAASSCTIQPNVNYGLIEKALLSDRGIMIFAEIEYRRGGLKNWWFYTMNSWPDRAQDFYRRESGTNVVPSRETMYPVLVRILKGRIDLR